MRRFNLVVVVVGCVWCAALAGSAKGLPHNDQGYGLGRTATPEEIKKYDMIIPPSGAGLPPGSGTAEKGKALYDAQCARCHGATGKEGPEDALVGGIGSLTTKQPQKTVGSFWPYATTLWDYLNRAMPFDRPGVLPPDDVYALTAYVLQLNGIVAATDVIDATTLPKIRMPNRDGFIPRDREGRGPQAPGPTRHPGLRPQNWNSPEALERQNETLNANCQTLGK